jgi:hypothetical protein
MFPYLQIKMFPSKPWKEILPLSQCYLGHVLLHVSIFFQFSIPMPFALGTNITWPLFYKVYLNFYHSTIQNAKRRQPIALSLDVNIVWYGRLICYDGNLASLYMWMLLASCFTNPHLCHWPKYIKSLVSSPIPILSWVEVRFPFRAN